MGIRNIELLSIIDAIEQGASLGKVITLGRQWDLTTDRFKKTISNRLGSIRSNNNIAQVDGPSSGQWADTLLSYLGATAIDSMDVTNYEEATIAHDLNIAIPEALNGKYDFVFDGGTSEHVFDVAQVYKNIFALCRVGGYVCCSVPANNHLGHGFYQFSPEFLYRLFCKENGFEVSSMILATADGKYRFHAVDPAIAGQRIEMYGSRPCLTLCMVAKKLEQLEPFQVIPMQSDYSKRWSGGSTTPVRTPSIRRWIGSILEGFFPGLVQYLRFRRSQRLEYHPDLFKRIP